MSQFIWSFLQQEIGVGGWGVLWQEVVIGIGGKFFKEVVLGYFGRNFFNLWIILNVYNKQDDYNEFLRRNLSFFLFSLKVLVNFFDVYFMNIFIFLQWNLFIYNFGGFGERIFKQGVFQNFQRSLFRIYFRSKNQNVWVWSLVCIFWRKFVGFFVYFCDFLFLRVFLGVFVFRLF